MNVTVTSTTGASTSGASVPLQGVSCSLAELSAARFAARHVDLPQLRRSLARQQGVSRAAVRGRGVEFEEVRPYQAGDDVRTIDWRVTARSDRPFTRLFREERERPLLLAVDQRRSMFFGSRTCFKSKLAAWLGALLGWAAIQRGDRVGALVFDDLRQHDLRPRRSRRTMTAWLQTLHRFNTMSEPSALRQWEKAAPRQWEKGAPRQWEKGAPRQWKKGALRHWEKDGLGGDSAPGVTAAASMEQALRNLERIARPGSATVLISDLAGAAPGPLAERLRRLARHGDVTVIWTVDPLERELPPPGSYQVADGDHRFVLDSGDARLRASFHEAFVTRQQELTTALGQAAIPLLVADTSAPPLQVLTSRVSAHNPRNRSHDASTA